MRDAAYSVVLPAYNAAPFLGETVASLLRQSLPPTRILIVDDGSTDDTASAVARLDGPITYVRQENAGPGSATTHGLALVETEYVATVDHDDLWRPTKAEVQMARLNAEPDVAAVFTRVVEFREDPSEVRHGTEHEGWTRTTLMMRTAVAHAAGPIIDTPQRLGEMVDWLARLREAGHRLVMLDDVLALRRLHAGSLTARGRQDLSRGYLATARWALLRRAQTGHLR